MKIAYNPKTAAVITTATAANDDILFDLNAKKVWAKGLRMGADWADISSKPSSLKNPHALTISLNGTSQGPYDGSAAKSINITPSSIGAAVSNHSHDYLVVNAADDKSFNSAYHNFLVLYAGGGNGITGKPANVDAFGLFKFRTASGWSGQMLLANVGSLYIRSSEDAKMTNTLAWKTILDSSNYSGILDSRYYTESEVNNLLSRKLDRVNLTTGSWNPRGYNLAADYNYNGGNLSISENDGKMYVSIDGYFWLNEGLYRVLDTSDVAELKNNLTVHLYLSNTDTTWYPLIWGGGGHTNTSDSTGAVYKSYDKLYWLTSSLTLYATHLKTTDLNTLTALFHPDNDSTLKIYSGKITDAKSNGNICLLTSIDGTDGLSHTYPTQYGTRCNLVLQPRGGQVYIGTNPDGGNTAYKLYVNGGVYASSFTGNASSATRLLTARTINGTIFNGTSDITTTYWGATRTISLTGAVTGSVSTNGSGNITINTTYGTGNITNLDSRYLKKTGDTMSGALSFSPTDSSDAAPKIYSTVSDSLTSLNFEVSDDTNDRFVFKINNWYDDNSTNRERFTINWNNVISKAPITAPSFNGNATSATKLQTPRNLWGNSFDGTKDINGSIIFPNIGDTATSNKISWSGSSDGADIYYLTTGLDLGNLVLNVKDDTNAYILLALNGVFKSHFDVANSYWTGRSALADKWTTARTFTIGNTAKNVDGSGNVSWSLAEIGVRDTWRTVQVNDTSIGNNTLNLCGSTYIGLTNVNGKVTFSLVGSGTTANQAILSNGTANGWTLKTLNIDNWNTAYNFVSTITGADTDNVINKWEEIVNFLAGITEDNKLNTLLNSKLSILLLSAKEILTTKTNNALYWVNTRANAQSITTGPFTDNPYALLSVTNCNIKNGNSNTFYRSRLAFSSVGDIKVASCHHENTTEYKLDDTWYNVLTSKNSGISGSTIKLNGTSITVYSSSTADDRYVKKSGDTMTGALNFANNIWNKVGDDVAIGDHNVAGCLGIKGLTAGPGLAFYNSPNTLLSKLVGTANLFLRISGNNTYNILDNSTTYINNNTITINGTSLTVSKSDHTHNIYAANENYGGFKKAERLPISGFYQSNESESGGNAPWENWMHLINCLHNNTGNNYALLIAASFYDNNTFKIRVTHGNVDNVWRDIIHSGNIGSQSVNYANSAGNTDMLDGYHANGLLTALSNSNRGISLTVGGTTKSLSNISVGDADTVDEYHIADESRQVYRNSYTVTDPAGAWILIKLPGWNANNEIVAIDGYGDNRQAHCVVHCGSRYQGIWGYQSDYNGTVVDRIGWKEVDSGKFALVALINKRITTLRIRATNFLEISKTTEGGATFVINSNFFSSGGVFHGNVDWDNITGRPSSFTPAAHTHTVFNNNLMIKGTNGVSDSASIHLGIGDSDTGFKWISDGKCLIYANNTAVGEWTSGGMNWFKNPTVNGNKVWNAGNDGPDSGLDADTVDGYHATSGRTFNGSINWSENWNDVWSDGTHTHPWYGFDHRYGLTGVYSTTLSDHFGLTLKTRSGNISMTKNGNVGIGLFDPIYKLLVAGNVYASDKITSAGFKHSGVTKNSDLYVLTADGGYTFLNLTSNELAHEFDVNITVTSEWLDIEDFYGGNLNFLTLPGTYIVLVYYTTNSANSMYEGYFSGIMSWYTGTTNSNNADEIVLHRVGHAYANTIYLRTRESLRDDPHPYTKLQISANSDLKQHTYKFKFKRIC